MAIALSAEDKRIIADIERQLAERKKAKGGAKELEAELKKARKGRTVAKFNSKGQTVEKAKTKVKSTRGKPPTAKKPEAKKPEAKTKVKSTRGKPPTVKKPEAKKPTVKKPEAKKPTVKKPTVKKPTVKKKPKAKKKPPSKLAKSLKAARGKPETPKATKALTRSLKDGRATPKPKPKAAPEKLKTSLKTSARSKPATPNSVKNKLLQSIKDSRAKPNTGKASVKAKPNTTPSKTSGNSKMKQSLRGARGKPLTPNANNVGPAGERIGGSSKTTIEKGGQRSKASTKGGRLAKVGKNLLKFAGPLAAISAGSALYDSVHPDKVKKRTGESKAGFGTKKTKPTTAQAATSSVASTTDKKGTGDKQTATTSSFGAAFRKAKDAGQKIFTWPKGGKSYSTATKDDVKKSGSKDLRGHLNAKSGKKATSFGTAFKAAKKEGKKTFKFNGKSYSTKTK